MIKSSQWPLYTLSLLAINSSFALADTIPVATQANAGQASIQFHLDNDNNNASVPVFLNNEAIQLSFDFNIADEDIGISSELYLLARKDDEYYMRNESGQWIAWNYPDGGLLATQKLTLKSQETLNVLDKNTLSAGEYFVYAAYRTADDNVKYNQQAVTFIVMDGNKPTLHAIKNPRVLSAYLSQTSVNLLPPDIAFNPFSGNSFSSSQISQTNIQEVGVDEGDMMKTKDNILFALEKCDSDNNPPTPIPVEPPILVAPPIAVQSEGLSIAPTNDNTCLAQYELSTNPSASRLLSKQTIGQTDYKKGELYLVDSSSIENERNEKDNKNKSNESTHDQLIWLHDSMQYNIQSAWGTPYYWQNNQTHIQFFDISQPETIQQTTELNIDGAILASRRIGDKLYLITRSNSYTAVIPLNNDFTNQLPQISIDQQTAKKFVSAENCYMPVSPSNKAYDGTIITISTIPVNHPEDAQATCIAGDIDATYVSTNALYLISSRKQYSARNGLIQYEPNYQTDIHKFALTDSHIDYRGSGVVPGHLGWQEDKRSFRMGENNGVLKIATSLGNNWSVTTTTRVGVFQESTDTEKQLEEISFIEDLGKPGERLYAARFIGDRGYLVTFRTTDPLYILDFSNAKNPQILGELEINGYSDYLHPIGDKYLLGIGKDAIADPESNDLGGRGRGAWYQGIKLSLFDVSSAENLKEIQSIVIGKRGSQSELLSDHHALAFLANNDGENFRISIPIEEHSTPYEQVDYNHPSKSYKWTQGGAYIFDINTSSTPSLNLSDTLITESSSNGDRKNYSNNNRIILQDNTVHYLHNNQVYSKDVN